METSNSRKKERKVKITRKLPTLPTIIDIMQHEKEEKKPRREGEREGGRILKFHFHKSI